MRRAAPRRFRGRVPRSLPSIARFEFVYFFRFVATCLKRIVRHWWSPPLPLLPTLCGKTQLLTVRFFPPPLPITAPLVSVPPGLPLKAPLLTVAKGPFWAQTTTGAAVVSYQVSRRCPPSPTEPFVQVWVQCRLPLSFCSGSGASDQMSDDRSTLRGAAACESSEVCTMLLPQQPPASVVVYVGGFGSGAGKSSACLALLHHAVHAGGRRPEQCAYIKPVTQCEAETDVVVWCRSVGVEATGVGPVVFRPGVTNEALEPLLAHHPGTGAGNDDSRQQQPHQEEEALRAFELRRDAALGSVVDAVDALRWKKGPGGFIVVDGVGYLSVGSCCGVGAAEVITALCHRFGQSIPTLLVAPPGLGDAIDTVTVMLAYLGYRRVRHVVQGGTPGVVAEAASARRPCLPAIRVIGVVQNKASGVGRHRVTISGPLVSGFFAASRWQAADVEVDESRVSCAGTGAATAVVSPPSISIAYYGAVTLRENDASSCASAPSSSTEESGSVLDLVGRHWARCINLTSVFDDIQSTVGSGDLVTLSRRQ